MQKSKATIFINETDIYRLFSEQNSGYYGLLDEKGEYLFTSPSDGSFNGTGIIRVFKNNSEYFDQCTFKDCIIKTANSEQSDRKFFFRHDGGTQLYECLVKHYEYEAQKIGIAFYCHMSSTPNHLLNQLEKAELFNKALSDILNLMLVNATLNQISELFLEKSLLMTHSEIGFVGYIDPISGHLIVPTFSGVMNDSKRRKHKEIVRFEKFYGLWGWVLENKKPLISNQAEKDPRCKEIPGNHVPIHRFMSVPALIGDDLKGVIALANPKQDYGVEDLDNIYRLAGFFALTVQRIMDEEQLKHIATFPEQNPDPVIEIDDDLKMIYMNPAAKAICEKRENHPLTKDIEAVVRSLDPKGEKPFIREIQIEHRIFKQMFFRLTYPNIIRVYSVDVTELENTRSNLERFRQAVNSSADTIFIIDSKELRFIDVNDTASFELGYSRDELLKMGPQNIEPEYTKDDFGTLFLGLSKNKQTYSTFETVHRRKNGSTFPVEVTVKSISGDSSMIIATARNITDRKRAETEIHKQNDFLVSILNSLPYPFYIIDVDTYEIKMANETAMDQSEFESCNKCYEIIKGNDQPCRLGYSPCPVRLIKKTKKPVVLEHLTETDNGPCYTEVHGYPIFNSEGEITEIIEYFQDITDRKRAELDMVKLTTGIDQSSSMIMITDLEGTIEFINGICEKYLGYQKSEIISKKPFFVDLFRGDDYLQHKMWKTISIGKPWNGRLRNRRKDGSHLWTETAVTPIKNIEEKMVSYIWIFDDITGKRNAETEMKKAKDAAEEANRLKTDFLANISHELRTPLNSIIGFAELLNQSESNPQKVEYLEEIKDASTNLMNLINSILDFSKIESGKINVHHQVFSIRKLMWNIRTLFKIKAEKKGLNFNIEITSRFPELIVGDEQQMGQILINLISNAIKFTETGTVKVSCDYQNQTSIFVVQDTGISIPKEKQKTVFADFNQADASITRKYGGTGLGLTITLKLIHLLNGKLDLKSEINQGTTFRVEIPSPEADEDVIFDKNYIDNKSSQSDFIKNWINEMDIGPEMDSIIIGIISGLPYKLVEIRKALEDKNYIQLKKLVKEFKIDSSDLQMKRMNSITKSLENSVSRNVIDPDKIYQMINEMQNIINSISEYYLSDTRRSGSDMNGSSLNAILIFMHGLVNKKIVEKIVVNKKIYSQFVNDKEELYFRLSNEYYDILVLDMDIPDLYGIEIINELRNNEQFRNILIIAVTRSLVSSDHEKILLAGADDIITKPIEPSQLENKLNSAIMILQERHCSIDQSEQVALNLNDREKKSFKEIIGVLKRNLNLFNQKEILKACDKLDRFQDNEFIKSVKSNLIHIAENFDDVKLAKIIDKMEKKL